MKLIAGLGNPGHTYEGTRHNVGFAVVQLLADRHQSDWCQRVADPVDGRPAAVASEYQEGGQPVRLLMPLTMMNESGEALKAIGGDPGELLIVCDDASLPLGVLRVRAEGGDGGHHGLRSCLEALGTERVARLRVGVGTTPLPLDLRDFVLSPFRSDERPLMKRSLEQAAEACESWVREGVDVTMNRYNSRAQLA